MSNGAKQRNSRPSSTFHLLAGLSSGFTSSLLLQPVDLLKTRVQQSASHRLVPVLRSIASSPNPVRQLWRGTLPSTIRTSVGSALYFATLERIRRALAVPTGASATQPAQTSKSSSLPRLSSAANLAAGAVARASVGFALMPVTVLKVRYESSRYGSAYSSLGLLGAARAIAAAEGLRGFFAGAAATAARDAPYAGLYVAFYEWAKGFVGGLAGASPAGIPAQPGAERLAAGTAAGVNFASGALAAALATAVTNPPDAVKTRMQLEPARYAGAVRAARDMWAEGGTRVFFDGLALRVTRKALSSALAWTVYEELVRWAEGVWVQRQEE